MQFSLDPAMIKNTSILLVDDDVAILDILAVLVEAEGYKVVTTQSPLEAKQLVKRQQFAVVMSDESMDELSGHELLKYVSRESPDTVRLMLTGHGADNEVVIRAINQGAVYRFLTKPWNDDELLATLRSAAQLFWLEERIRRLEELTKRQNRELKDLAKNLERLNQGLEQEVVNRTAKITRIGDQFKAGFMGSVEVMSSLVETLAGESTTRRVMLQRSAELARQLCLALNVEKVDVLQITIAARLGDIGKFALPWGLVQKERDQISRQERDQLRTHVLYGEAFVAKMPNLVAAAKYIRHQHEAFDGTGYPDGLKGDQIPLGARIMAVVSQYVSRVGDSDSQGNIRDGIRETSLYSKSLLDPVIVDKLLYATQNLAKEREGKQPTLTRRKDLAPGLVLACDILTPRWILMHGTQLTKTHVDRIQATEEHLDDIYVYPEA